MTQHASCSETYCEPKHCFKQRVAIFANSSWQIKGRFRKRVVLANVPSFRFSFQGNIRMYPRSGFRSGGTSAKTTLLENHPFGNPRANSNWELRIPPMSGHVRPQQGTEICNFGAPTPLEALHWIFGFFSSIYVQFSKTSPLKSGESSEKSSGENRVKSCHVCGCHGFFGPDNGKHQRCLAKPSNKRLASEKVQHGTFHGSLPLSPILSLATSLL